MRSMIETGTMSPKPTVIIVVNEKYSDATYFSSQVLLTSKDLTSHVSTSSGI